MSAVTFCLLLCVPRYQLAQTPVSPHGAAGQHKQTPRAQKKNGFRQKNGYKGDKTVGLLPRVHVSQRADVYPFDRQMHDVLPIFIGNV